MGGVNLFESQITSLPPRLLPLLADEAQEQWEGGVGHLAVVVALEFEQFHGGVSHFFEHAPEVGALFVAAEEFVIAIAAN